MNTGWFVYLGLFRIQKVLAASNNHWLRLQNFSIDIPVQDILPLFQRTFQLRDSELEVFQMCCVSFLMGLINFIEFGIHWRLMLRW